MSPRSDSLLSRRRFLLAGGSVLGLGSVAYVTNTLPAPVVDARTKRVGIPSVPPRIKIPTSHVRAAKAHVHRIIDEAETEWNRADTSSLKKFDRDFLRHKPEASQDTIDDISDDTGTLQTLESCQWAVGNAAETLGAARYLNDDGFADDLDHERSTLRHKTKSLRDRIAYEGEDSNDFFVHVGRVEHHAQQATAFHDLISTPEDAMEAGEALDTLESARRDWDDGRRLYRRYRNRLENPTSFAEVLARNRRRLAREAERLQEQHEENEFERKQDSPYEWVRCRIWSQGWRYGRNILLDAKRHEKDGYQILSTVKTADALQHFLSWQDAKRRVEVPTDAERIDPKRVFRAKKQAVSELHTALGKTDDGSFARNFLDTARTVIESGDWSIDDDKFPRAEAYARYLLGWAYAKHAPKTARRLTA